MSEVKVNKISPRTACGTVTLGDSGDTFTIPSGATITNSGTASGFGATGETSWDTTVKTTGTFTATAGVGYFLNTTGGIITVNLAAGTAGDSVAMADYAGTWQTNNVTVAANGTEKIGGVDADVTLSTEGQSVTFVYIDGTQGWVNVLDSTSNVRGNAYLIATGGTITCSGDFKIHTFTGPGTFTVTCAAISAPDNAVDYVVTAGGSGGGWGGPAYSTAHLAGGGGAGGYRESPGSSTCYTASPLGTSPAAAVTVSASPGAYAIVVGGGGAAGPSATSPGVTGGTSSALCISSAGGGGGGGGDAVGVAGGSGGGGGPGPCTPRAGGAGNTPPVTPAQGKAGGLGAHSSGGARSGGGGGATACGGDGTGGPYPVSCTSKFGLGGAGATSCISATPTAYGGGGGGSSDQSAVPINSKKGGVGGGGAGADMCGVSVAGTPNSGGGGGAGASDSPGAYSEGGAGGSGIVILRYKFQ